MSVRGTITLELCRQHLERLRISGVDELDVLVFIYHHGTSLASADQIGRLLGHSSFAVAAALESLTSAGLIQRSRSSHGVRLYRIADAVEGDGRRAALDEFVRVAGQREGRLRLIKLIKQPAARRDRPASVGLRLV